MKITKDNTDFSKNLAVFTKEEEIMEEKAYRNLENATLNSRYNKRKG